MGNLAALLAAHGTYSSGLCGICSWSGPARLVDSAGPVARICLKPPLLHCSCIVRPCTLSITVHTKPRLQQHSICLCMASARQQDKASLSHTADTQSVATSNCGSRARKREEVVRPVPDARAGVHSQHMQLLVEANTALCVIHLLRRPPLQEPPCTGISGDAKGPGSLRFPAIQPCNRYPDASCVPGWCQPG